MKNLYPKGLLAILCITYGSVFGQANYAKHYMTNELENKPVVYINLFLQVPEEPVLLDGVAEVYDQKYSRTVDDYDATKLSNFTENIALMRDGYKLAIETRPFPAHTDTMYLRMWQMKRQDYILQTAPQYTPGAVKAAFLVDNYLNKKTQLSLYKNTDYNFTVSADTASYYNRFMIVFGVLRNDDKQPVNAANLTASKQEGAVRVYPNPVINRQAMIQFDDMEKGAYKLQLYKQANKVSETNVDYNGGKHIFKFACGSGCQPGIYQLIITNKITGKRKNLSLIIS